MKQKQSHRHQTTNICILQEKWSDQITIYLSLFAIQIWRIQHAQTSVVVVQMDVHIPCQVKSNKEMDYWKK